jgi:RNA polymerase sigma factor (TIGR02999 family)
MRRERPDHTLQATAVVHEAYLRLLGNEASFQNRAHFFGAAAEAMRRVLIDSARRKRAEKRGGDLERVTLAEVAGGVEDGHLDVLELDDALTKLAAVDARLAEVTKLRYFAGLSIPETAEVLEISPATVKRDWTFARAWLFEWMADEA